MIDRVNYRIELPSANVYEKRETTTPYLSVLLVEFNSFRKEVFFLRSQYQGPDYFNILENISDLQSLMDSIIDKLKIQVGDLNTVPCRTLSGSFDYLLKKNKVQFNSDVEGITLILLGLKKIIQTNRKAALEAEELQEFFIESLLLEFDKELEKSKWIFHLFSKY